jgi:DNA-binding XRE family transcriptional regulator
VKLRGDEMFLQRRRSAVERFVREHHDQLQQYFAPELNIVEVVMNEFESEAETNESWKRSELYRQFRGVMHEMNLFQIDADLPLMPNEPVEIQIVEDDKGRFARFVYSELTKFYEKEIPDEILKLSNGVHLIEYALACEMYSGVHTKINELFAESLRDMICLFHLDEVKESSVYTVVQKYKKMMGKQKICEMFRKYVHELYSNVYDSHDLDFFADTFVA